MNISLIVKDGSPLARMLDWLANLFDSKPSTIKAGDFAFRISASARRKILRQAGLPRPDLVPCLCHAFSYDVADKNGKEISGYDQSHYIIGFDKPGKRESGFELSGMMIAASRETIAILNSKTLVIKIVDIGRPNPKSKRGSVLVAE